MKFAGAEWLKSSQVERWRSPSPFGEKVADVLGQVAQGIYHLDEDLNYPRTNWGSDSEIEIPFSQCLATFDSSHLTLLLLCCEAAEIDVAIAPHSRRAMRLRFTPRTNQPSQPSVSEAFTLEGVVNLFAKPYDALFCDDSAAEVRLRKVSFERLSTLVQICHDSCLRGSLTCLSNQSIKLTLSRRLKRDGRVDERHPTYMQAIAEYKPIWSVLLPEIQNA